MTQRHVGRGSSHRSTRLGAAALALVLGTALAGCGGGGSTAVGSKKPDSQPIEGGSQLAALWPLTGEPVTGSTPDRPVLVTKIDNTPNSQPQIGLKKADLVTEELVEGGITRLAVFFYRRLPEVAGPVRSLRASDIGIVQPAHGVLVASGGAPPTLRRLKQASVPFFEEGGPGYFRDTSRRAPYNLMVRLPKVASAAKKRAVVPASYLPWGKESDFAGSQRATRVQARFSPSHATSWTYQGGRYRNDNSFAAAGEQFAPDSVLVLRVREGDAGYLDPAGHRVPETIYSGTGAALLFHGGKVVRGTWKKTSRETPLRLSTASGTLTVPAGHVWIELLPNDKAGGRLGFNR
jgi:hypothetical protein